MLVFADRAELATIADALTRAGFEVLEAGPGETLEAAVRRLAPAVAVVSARRHGVSTAGHVAELVEDLELGFVAVLIVAPSVDDEALGESLALGADDFVVHPGHEATLCARVRSLARQKDSADALAWHTAQLHELAEERSAEWRALVTGLPGAVLRLDEHGLIDLVSRRVLEYEPSQLFGRPLGVLGVDAAGQARIDGLVRTVLDAERDVSDEFDARRATGEPAIVAVQMGPVRLRERVRGAVVYVADVTAQKRAEEEQHKLADQLRQTQKLEAIGRLAGSVAHDFNNMLGVILSYATMLADEHPQGSTTRDDATQIVQAARRAEALTKRLLTLGRKQQAQSQAVSLSSIVEGMAPLFKSLAEHDVRLETRLWARGRDLVWVDVAQVEQALMNVVVNARDAMPSGGTLTIEVLRSDEDARALVHEHDRALGPATITPPSALGTPALGLRPYVSGKPLARRPTPAAMAAVGRASLPPLASSPWVELRVTDTGLGMDEATKSRLFEPFFTTKPVGKGTGLGLATVYGTVTQAGGTVAVESALGRGTTFRLQFPLHRGAAPPRESLRAPAPRPSAQGKATVLLLDDEPTLRDVAARALRKRGYEVLVAADLEEAVAFAHDHAGPIDLLLTDVVMPSASGPEAAEILRLERPDLRVLYATGWAGDKLLQYGLAESADVLHKPFTPDELIARVEQALAFRV